MSESEYVAISSVPSPKRESSVLEETIKELLAIPTDKAKVIRNAKHQTVTLRVKKANKEIIKRGLGLTFATRKAVVEGNEVTFVYRKAQ